MVILSGQDDGRPSTRASPPPLLALPPCVVLEHAATPLQLAGPALSGTDGVLCCWVPAGRPPAGWRSSLGQLPSAETARAVAFVHEEHQWRYLVAHLAVRRLLAARLQVPPSAVPLRVSACHACGGAHGKPVVDAPDLHYSISYSRGSVLIAVAGTAVGIDVEHVVDDVTVDSVAPTLHDREREELTRCAPQDRGVAFTRAWTRKEAYLKGLGVGLTRPPARDYVGATSSPRSPRHDWDVADLPPPATVNTDGTWLAALAVHHPAAF